MKKVSFLFVFFIIASACKSQDKNIGFIYKSVDKNLIVKVNIEKNQGTIKYVDLESYLPYNFVKDGTVDYGIYLQKGIDENSYVNLPDFPILISEKGLSVKSNSIINFSKNSKLIIAVNSLPKYQILDLRNVTNVKIYGPRLVGDKSKHLGTAGEWGMGINILSSTNITIYNPEIINCWGDGIYISSLAKESENVTIKGGFLDNNRRNGISIISGKNINISNVYVSNTNGVMPMAGIDIEPNENKNVLENITLRNINTFNNGNVGIEIFLINMVGKEDRKVDIKIDSHKDYYSRYSFMMAGFNKEHQYVIGVKPLTGLITVKNSKWNDNPYRVSVGYDFSYMPKYYFSNLDIKQEGKIDTKTEDVKKIIRSKGFSVE